MKMWSNVNCGRAGVMMMGVTFLLLLVTMMATHAQAAPVEKREIDGLPDGRQKRPFCNAFAGCGPMGRKRSDPSVGLENLASGAELDEMAKHVLAEAKLWEQLQNKMEAMRALASRMDSQHTLFRRKRSVASPKRHHDTNDNKHQQHQLPPTTTNQHKEDTEKQ